LAQAAARTQFLPDVVIDAAFSEKLIRFSSLFWSEHLFKMDKLRELFFSVWIAGNAQELP
jgi:hypothetical protein